VLVWLSVWSEVQIVCIWSSWCHCHPQTPSSLAWFKSRLVLLLWYWFTQDVLEKRPLNWSSYTNLMVWNHFVAELLVCSIDTTHLLAKRLVQNIIYKPVSPAFSHFGWSILHVNALMLLVISQEVQLYLVAWKISSTNPEGLLLGTQPNLCNSRLATEKIESSFNDVTLASCVVHLQMFVLWQISEWERWWPAWNGV